jgi:hypothetical protein
MASQKSNGQPRPSLGSDGGSFGRLLPGAGTQVGVRLIAGNTWSFPNSRLEVCARTRFAGGSGDTRERDGSVPVKHPEIPAQVPRKRRRQTSGRTLFGSSPSELYLPDEV